AASDRQFVSARTPDKRLPIVPGLTPRAVFRRLRVLRLPPVPTTIDRGARHDAPSRFIRSGRAVAGRAGAARPGRHSRESEETGDFDRTMAGRRGPAGTQDRSAQPQTV